MSGAPNPVPIPSTGVPFIDPRTNGLAQVWRSFFLTLSTGGRGWDKGGNLTVTSLSLQGNVTWTQGVGNPNGVVTASPGSLYSDTSGGGAARLWVKESGGSGNTGWVAK